jgi:hypothetical protein
MRRPRHFEPRREPTPVRNGSDSIKLAAATVGIAYF